MQVGTLIRVKEGALITDGLEGHGLLWVVCEPQLADTLPRDEGDVDAKALATGKEWHWYWYEYEHA